MKTGAQILLECLTKEGVDTIFGYPGARTLLVHDALHGNEDFRHVLVRHEQGAAHAADGYARTTGRVGVCLTTSGPGATNLVTGIATAYMDSVPMVALTCQVTTADIGNDAFQEADMTGITRPITKHNYIVTDVDDLARIVREAFHVARTRRPGPVLVDLPSDVLAAATDKPIPESVARRGYQEVPALNKKQLKRAAGIINGAKRPLIYAGGGVVMAEAVEALRSVAGKGNIPVTHTLMAIGAMDHASPLSIGMLGMYGAFYANMAVSECDCLIAVGARFDDRVAGRVDAFAPKARIVHIDIDPSSIRKNVQVEVPIVGDARQALEGLLGLVEERDRGPWLEEIQEWRKEFPLPAPQSPDLMPHEVIEAIRNVAGEAPLIASDVGLSQMWTANYFGFSGARQYITSGGLGTMGYALPAAVGAALGNPGRPVIAINGDGAFQMNVQELATCAHYGLPVKTIILNNGKLGMVRQFQKVFLKERFAATCLGPGVDFCTVARGFGVQAFKVERKADLQGTLARAMAAPGPAVIDVDIDPYCYCFPMVPPGKKATEAIFCAEDWEG
ncbi:MAG: acetolactate synthase, large subunit, biosynthetic type [Desulfuromonas sp.]|uniref:biosynthetic-type acetolactate synthase large subunit n=1 Tax=Desulfuromonas sp. TaxID=892 RepID=UPI000CB236B6|nr:biosynthetic-type acetolactate synthase large subunit [Desulfuromonas sp.]PLX86700.1 MAG: acetolactate synthase, large subunit, biosynthetic type [Desulfuromonas sp.]